uniref:Uncharacterized protein n=1 Tax=uncultured Desulfobacterium sp. TaxID=201089 RepID=E1YK83_9BACT|nr:unknown protein [uncultured Desulfobacterium sp.]
MDFLIDYVKSNGFLFHSPDEHAYVSWVENGHEKNIKIRCEDFRKILIRAFYMKRMGTSYFPHNYSE